MIGCLRFRLYFLFFSMNDGNRSNNKQKHKISYLFTFLIGLGIGCGILSIATAQFTDNQQPIDTIAEQAVSTATPYYRETKTWDAEETVVRTVVVSKPTVSESRPSNNTDSSSWMQSDGYWVWVTGMIYAIKSIWVPTSYAETIANTCKATGRDFERCSEFATAIPAIESALFTRCGYDWHNCYWLWGESRLMKFKSVEAGIIYRIWIRADHWYTNDTARDYITRSWYCKWDCSDLSKWDSNRIRVVNSTIQKMRKFY